MFDYCLSFFVLRVLKDHSRFKMIIYRALLLCDKWCI